MFIGRAWQLARIRPSWRSSVSSRPTHDRPQPIVDDASSRSSNSRCFRIQARQLCTEKKGGGLVEKAPKTAGGLLRRRTKEETALVIEKLRARELEEATYGAQRWQIPFLLIGGVIALSAVFGGWFFYSGILGRRRRATLEDRSDEEVNIKAKLPVTSDGEAQELLEEVRAELESITGIDTGDRAIPISLVPTKNGQAIMFTSATAGTMRGAIQERHIDKIFIPPNLTQLEAGRMLVGRLMEAYLLVNDLGRDLPGEKGQLIVELAELLWLADKLRKGLKDKELTEHVLQLEKVLKTKSFGGPVFTAGYREVLTNIRSMKQLIDQYASG